MGTGSFPGVKSSRGVTLTVHPILLLWSWNSRAILLFPLWAIRPVQSLSACTRVTFNFTLLYSLIFCCDGMTISLRGTADSIGPVAHPPDVNRNECSAVILKRKPRSTDTESCSNPALSTTNPTRADLAANPRSLGRKAATTGLTWGRRKGEMSHQYFLYLRIEF